jgi:hypothetical protein
MTTTAVVDDSFDCYNPSKGMKSMQSLNRLHNCNFSFFYFTGTNAITVTMKANKSKESSTTATGKKFEKTK